MSRRYREHDLRSAVPLDGVREFVFLGHLSPDDVDVATIQYNDRMAVPGCFATPAYAGQQCTLLTVPFDGRQCPPPLDTMTLKNDQQAGIVKGVPR